MDNDGFGLTDQSVESCTSPVGHVENDGDCDDTSSAISPMQLKCNELDDDCNDQINDDNAAGRLAYFQTMTVMDLEIPIKSHTLVMY